MPEQPETRPGEIHVLDELLELVTGRLDADQTRRVTAHLGRCRECAAHHRFLEHLQEDLVQQGAAHLSPARLVALADAPADPATAEEAGHLEACARCREELRWSQSAPALEEVLAAEGIEAPSARTATPAIAGRKSGAGSGLVRRLAGTWSIPWLRWAALGVATAAVVLLWVRPPGNGLSYSRLALLQPLPASDEMRGVEGSVAFQQVFDKALRAYRSGDYHQAEPAFAEAAEVDRTQHEVYLYLGSSRLLLRDARGAISALRTAASLADSRRLREESQWQMANAFLLAGRPDSARARLAAVIVLDSDRRPEAERLLRAIGR